MAEYKGNLTQGKGDERRPAQVSRKEFEARWEETFGKKEK